jgi:hypothetical protein
MISQQVQQVQPPAPKMKMLKPAEEFRQWCEEQMQTFPGIDGMTLVDFLLSLGSAGEVTEYVQVSRPSHRPIAYPRHRCKRGGPLLLLIIVAFVISLCYSRLG